MKLATTRPPTRRGAFTLIELLVVIAIIAVLVSLTSAAVFYAYTQAARTRVHHEISDLNKAVVAFQTDFGLTYVPSRLILCDREVDYYVGGNPANGFVDLRYQDSHNFLMKMWPRLNWQTPQAGGRWVGIDWNNNGSPDTVELQGQHVLVWLTGGIQSVSNGTPSVNGFSNNPAYPAALGGARRGPYYGSFQSSRLVADSTAGGYFVYRDSSGGNAFAFFSSFSYKNSAGQPNRYTGIRNAAACDCANLGFTAAYFDPAGKFFQPDSFQIISAGANGQFGQGGQWNPASPMGSTAIKNAAGAPVGQDDMSNFSSALLGVPQS